MNQKKTIKIDVAIIGAGPGGTAAALSAADAGLTTVIIDENEIGGTCLNRGCVPAKTWLAAEHLKRRGEWGSKLGYHANSGCDYEKLKLHQQSVVSLVRKGLVSVFKKKGISIINGRAAFTSNREIALNGGETTVEFKHAVIATGSRPIDLFGNHDGFYNTDSIFGLDKLPSSIAIIGAGAAGIELATFFGGMGCGVTLIEALPDILPMEDGEIRSVVKRELKKSGVSVKTGVSVKSAFAQNGSCVIETDEGKTVNADILLSAIGRKANTASLGLEKALVKTDVRGFLEVDGTLSTGSEGIYGVGDAVGKIMLAYTAHHEGIIAAKNISGEPAHMDYRFVPSIIFCNPEVGSVGASEEELKHTGTKYRAGRYHIRALARAQASGEIVGMVKALVGENNKLLGLHIAAPLATELIHSASVAMSAGMTADKLADTVYGHPTFSEAIPLAVADAIGKSIYS